MPAPSQAFSLVGDTVDTAVKNGIVSGAVVLCASEGTIRFLHASGARQMHPERLPASIGTVYDIASVTKAVSTSVLAMNAVAAGLVALDDAVAAHLPEFHGEQKSIVTIRQLLCHASGLPAHRPFYERYLQPPMRGEVAARRRAILLASAAEPLVNAPGSTAVYSDLGFIVLGWLLERVTGSSLDALFESRVARPLNLRSTRFVNLDDDEPDTLHTNRDSEEVAATELCPRRGRLIRGEVHDLNAFAMGGVAGHAGLFSEAADLNDIATALVASWHGARAVPGLSASGALGIPQDVVREFWRPAGIAGSNWRLGWDGPAARDSQAGQLMSRAAVGHLGFTGCSLWIDPERALSIVLLTNRVHPTVRDDPRFRSFRATAHDNAITALTA